MMLTREQAAATWCPMVRLVKADGSSVAAHQVAFNRADIAGKAGIVSSSRCIADQCAMWRWGVDLQPAPDPFESSRGKVGKFPLPPRPYLRIQSDRGYCGLAGAPVIMGGAS